MYIDFVREAFIADKKKMFYLKLKSSWNEWNDIFLLIAKFQHQWICNPYSLLNFIVQ